MAKAQTRYVCRQCGHESPKWLGKCPSCDEWGTLEETIVATPPKSLGARASLPTSFVGQSKPQRLSDVPSPSEEGRLLSGMGEFDRVLGGGIVRGALTLIGGDPGVGKCLAGSERIFDPATGAYLPITEWAEQPRPVLALNETTHRLTLASVSMFHSQGVRGVVQVTTRLGRTLRCTPNHPVLTPDGWRPVADLTPGTRIASPRILPFFGSQSLDDNVVRLIAYILSDGSAQSAISVTSMLPERVGVEELAADAVRSASMTTSVARVLEELGLRFSRAQNKAVPQAVFCLPKPQLALFLKVLFSCDGSVYVTNPTTPGLSYSTISQRLAQDVQHLLLRFGFITKLRTKESRVNGSPYVAYEIQMLGVQEVKRFLDEIGIWGRKEAKEKIADLSAPSLPAPSLASTHFDTIPLDTIPLSPCFWQHLSEAAGNISLPHISRMAGVTIRSRLHDRPLCRRTVTALADTYPTPYLRRLVDGDVYWDEIRQIVPAGEEPVFDISVPEGANFVANDLIVHNSTLLTQVAGQLATRGGKTLYVSGEESATQIKLRAERLGITGGDLLLHNETDVTLIAATIQAERPLFVIIDSIQTMQHPEIESSAGSVSQVRAATAQLALVAKGEGIPIFLVGHVTKDGALAGPRVLEHMVDTVLTFEGDRHYTYRILRAVKNRFGSTDELGLFEMHEEGLVEVPNPSEMLLAERTQNTAGSAVLATVEGTRPLLIEVQALVAPSYLSNPRRTVAGVDANRVNLILAVLEKRVGISLANQDVFVNLAGGVRVDEPAADLAVAVAVASNFQERPVDSTTIFAGEVGLGGEVRAVGHMDLRLREAARMGFRQAIICARNKAGLRRTPDLKVIGVDTVRQALEAALTRP